MPFSQYRDYSDEYKELCYQAWLLHNCPRDRAQLQEIIPADIDGRKPTPNVVAKWKLKYDWVSRADIVRVEAMEKSNELLVQDRTEVLREQLRGDLQIADKAKKHLLNKGFDTSTSAVQALFKSNEEVRTLYAISDFIERVSRMTPDDIVREIRERAERLNVVDAEIGETEEVMEEENKAQEE